MRIMFLNQAPRDPNQSDAELEAVQQLLASYASPGTEIEVDFPEDYPGALVHKIQGRAQRTNGLHHAMEAPGLVRKAVWAAENGFDAVIQSNTFDPGVEASRLAVRIPVIGLLRTALHVGANLADRIVVITPLESDIPSCRRTIEAYRMDHMVAAMTSLEIYSDDLAARRAEIFDRACELIEGLKRDHGAQCVLPLGGKLIPYVVDPDALAARTEVPVLNTKAIGVRFAEICVGLGLSHAEAAYPHTDIPFEAFTKGVGGPL
jgi:Asp/Glu/hydantoin racemase